MHAIARYSTGYSLGLWCRANCLNRRSLSNARLCGSVRNKYVGCDV